MCACTGVVVIVFSSSFFTVGQAAIFTALVVSNNGKKAILELIGHLNAMNSGMNKIRYRKKTLDRNTITRFTINLIDFAFAYSSVSNVYPSIF